MQNEAMAETVSGKEELSAFQKVIGVFTSPGKTFVSIDANPGWLLPVILIAVVNLVFVFAAQDILVQETLAQQQTKMEERGMDSDQIAQALTTTENVMKYTTPVFAAIMPFILLLIVSGIFMFVGNVVLGGTSTYKKILSVTAYSWLVISLGALVALPLVLAKETVQVSFSLAAMMSDEARETLLYKLLEKVDVFAIWWLAVESIGLAVIYKMKTQKVATAVVVVYAIYAVVASALAVAFS